MLLFVSDGYQYNGKGIYKIGDIEQILRSVPTIEKVVTIPNLKESLELKTDKCVYDWRDVANIKGSKLEFEQMEFNESLWVLFTSGTTGMPKPVVHGHGGILIESLKASLHLNIKQEDKFLWYSTPTWMMWNAVVDALLYGTHIVFYDGSPVYKNLIPLWEIAEKEELTILGTSA
jgi:acetoacetyl-CoA synthetase